MPRSPLSPRARRLAIAAAVANSTGAAAGATAHFLGCDPETSVSVGVFVSSSVADVLKQWASADHTDPIDPAGTDTTELTTEFNEPRNPVELSETGTRTAPDNEMVESEATGPAVPGPCRVHRTDRRYGRCTHPTAPSIAVPSELLPPRATPAGPRHAGHRHLHRGAQKFVRRAHDRVSPGGR
ncbi:hypothetical protein ABTX85_36435 [Streptomyces sp. NPDC096097]|uniref:hypothetical protein n=1 Tax=Streptomyces sp. NPDC096097 TaxID=3155546 RepID=UPI00331FC82D